MKKAIIVIIVLAVLGTIFYLYSKKVAKAPNANLPQTQNQTAAQNQDSQSSAATSSAQTDVKGGAGSDYIPPQTPGGGENLGSDIQVYEVDFDGTAYSPNISNLKAGDYIFFKNKSAGDFWPVAGSASTLAAYPGFNPSQPIASGGEYKFQFSKVGNWSFGDNLRSNRVFSVNVSQ